MPPPVDALPRERQLDPDAWLSVTAWTIVVWSCTQVLLFSHGRDQAIYATVADALLGGSMPYQDAWDFKPPGIYLVYALAQAVFGKTMLAPRLLEVAGLLGMVFGMRRLAHTFFGARRVGLVGGALAAFIHAQFDFWHTGQPETFGGFLTIAALVLTSEDLGRRRRVFGHAAVGVLFGLAFLLKPPLAGGALVAAMYLARGEYDRTGKALAAAGPVGVIALGSVLPIALCAGWFALRGAWPALHWTFFEFTPGYTKLSWTHGSAGQMFYYGLEEAFFRFSALAAFGVIAAAVMRPIHGREREGIFLLLGVISIQVAGIAMQGKFFQYHYGATVPLVAFFGGLGLYKLYRRCVTGGSGALLAFAAFVVVGATMRTAVRDLGSVWERALHRTSFLLRTSPLKTRELLDKKLYRVADYDLDANRRVAMELRQRTAPGEAVFVWGFEPGIYWLAERRVPTRFIYNVPQRARWGRDATRHELLSALERDPPRVIVVQHGDRFWWVTGDDYDSAEALRAFAELDAMLRDHYSLATTVSDFDVYERKADMERARAP